MHLIGIDIGTTGLKVILYDIEGKIIKECYEEYPVITPRSGWVELDPKKVWKVFKKNLYKVVNKFPETDFAMSFSVLGDAVIPLNRDGEVIYPAILSSDVRSVDYVKKIDDYFGSRKVFDFAGRWAHTMCPLTKILWLKDNMPDIFKNSYKFLDYLAWINHKLGFQPVTDYSSASASLYFDINQKDYADDVLKWADISKKQLPEIKKSGIFLGALSGHMAEQLGFQKDAKVKVSLGAMDQQCNALGTGTVNPGKISCSTGTVECATIILQDSISNDDLYSRHLLKISTAVPGQFANMAFLWTGGGSLKWFRNNFCTEEIVLAQKQNINAYNLIEGDERPISDIFFLPHLAGSGTPWWDSFSKGAFLGLSLATTKAKMIDAVMEGVTFNLNISLENLEELGLKKGDFAVVGGGSKSEKWNQLKANILQRKVVSMAHKEGGALGASILAGYGAGIFTSLKDTSLQMAKIEKTYYPQDKKTAKYARKYEIFKEIYSSLRDINHQISQLNFSD